MYIWSFVKTLNIKKVYNSMLIRLSYTLAVLTQKLNHWGKLESLAIEPTNLCNLKCPECPSGNNSLTRAKLFIAESHYKEIIDQTYQHLVYLQLYFQGEPFMHPKITDYIKYAVNKNIFTSTSTNGHFLTHENCNKIVNSGLHELIVSIDGTTQEIYEKYRVGGSLDKVISGLSNLQKAKLENKKHTPHIVMQFVVLSTNEHQIPAIKKIAKKLKINDLRFKSAQIHDYKNGNSLMPVNPKYNRYKKYKTGFFELKGKKNFKCFRIWNSSVISAQGHLLPCCFDKNSAYSYDHTEGYEIHLIWKNQKANTFRKKVWQQNNKYDICENCTEGLQKTWFK